jgi:hypothetical protein
MAAGQAAFASLAAAGFFLFFLCGIFVSFGLITSSALAYLRVHAKSPSSRKRFHRLQLLLQRFAPLERGRTIYNVILLPVCMVVIILVWYVESWFQRVPQTFGGAKERCASLDQTATQLSAQTAKNLGLQIPQTPSSVVQKSDGVPMAQAPAVVQTPPLKVIFVGTTTVIVRILKDKNSAPNAEMLDGTGPTYELLRSQIQTITWCAEKST